jgi:hypothetical protein
MTSLFQYSTSLSSVAILHQRVESTFDHLDVILEFVLSKVIVSAADTEAEQPRLRYAHVERGASNILPDMVNQTLSSTVMSTL